MVIVIVLSLFLLFTMIIHRHNLYRTLLDDKNKSVKYIQACVCLQLSVVWNWRSSANDQVSAKNEYLYSKSAMLQNLFVVRACVNSLLYSSLKV